jgi:hypothetical protein
VAAELSGPALALRRDIMATLAATGAPPEVHGHPALHELAAAHVVVLDADGRIRMAHPFAAPGGAAEVRGGRRRWWGSCAWDGLGLVAALELDDATVTGNGVTLHMAEGELLDDAWFHVAVPAARWWEDIAHT